ncbi:MAG: hypothetical protein K6T31_07285 [Alicyclobacillus sp.]|nr:hypothetical protein [Alicyclobacillus sp.]
MLETGRGHHTCYLCQSPVSWVGHVRGGLVVSHGTETHADIVLSKARNPQNQVGLSVQLQCPRCGAVNQFETQHAL